MADSIRERIVQAVLSVVQGIRPINGYEIDLSTNAKRAIRSFGIDELPAASIWINTETSEKLYTGTKQTAEVVIDFHHEIVSNESVDITANRMIADVRKAMETYDATLSGLVSGINFTEAEPRYPEDGDSVVSISVTYAISYTTVKGDPYSII